MPQKFYYSKTLQKYSQVVVGNLSHGFGKSKFPDSKMDWKFCSLQSSEEENYKYMKKFMTTTFALFNTVKKKIARI